MDKVTLALLKSQVHSTSKDESKDFLASNLQNANDDQAWQDSRDKEERKRQQMQHKREKEREKTREKYRKKYNLEKKGKSIPVTSKESEELRRCRDLKKTTEYISNKEQHSSNCFLI